MPRGSKPGERRGGRLKGTPNKITVELKETLTETAKQYTAQSIQTLVDIMGDAKASPAARAVCANSILDRGWGKAPQTLEHTGKGGGPIQHTIAGLLSEIDGSSRGLPGSESAAR